MGISCYKEDAGEMKTVSLISKDRLEQQQRPLLSALHEVPVKKCKGAKQGTLVCTVKNHRDSCSMFLLVKSTDNFHCIH